MSHRATILLSTLSLASLASAAMTMTHSGKFHSLHAPTSGTATVRGDGMRATLTLSNFKTEVAPDLEVWLYRGEAPRKGAKDADIAKGKYLKVGMFKTSFQGTFRFDLPAGTKLSDYKSVVLWCDLVKTAFGAAPLM